MIYIRRVHCRTINNSAVYKTKLKEATFPKIRSAVDKSYNKIMQGSNLTLDNNTN